MYFNLQDYQYVMDLTVKDAVQVNDSINYIATYKNVCEISKREFKYRLFSKWVSRVKTLAIDPEQRLWLGNESVNIENPGFGLVPSRKKGGWGL